MIKREEVLRKKASEMIAPDNDKLQLEAKRKTSDEADKRKQDWIKAMCELAPKIESLRISLLTGGPAMEKFREELNHLPFWVHALGRTRAYRLPLAFSSDPTRVEEGLTAFLQICEVLLASLARPMKPRPRNPYSRADKARYERITAENFNKYTNPELWRDHRVREQRLTPGLTKFAFCRSVDRIRKEHDFFSSSEVRKKSDQG
jgi:hypothetical protein